jgi:hypothetical protein
MVADGWPRPMGEHTVGIDWVCVDCGQQFDSIEAIRNTICE